MGTGRATSSIFVIALMTGASAAERWALPDPSVTPGAINPAATLGMLCTRPAALQTKPLLPAWVTEFEESSYNIPASNSANYVLDYLIPLSLGGANTISNVWLLPRGDAERKAELEGRALTRLCTASQGLPPREAADVLANVQRNMAEDWTAAYADYVDR